MRGEQDGGQAGPRNATAAGGQYGGAQVEGRPGGAAEATPVAVFFDAADLTVGRLQRIAREMNLSEVRFLLPPAGDADLRVRIFTR